MIEYFVTQNLPFGGVLLFYLFYNAILLVVCFHIYFHIEGIRTDIKYKKLGEERAERFRLERYEDFKLGVKEINKFYSYWRVI